MKRYLLTVLSWSAVGFSIFASGVLAFYFGAISYTALQVFSFLYGAGLGIFMAEFQNKPLSYALQEINDPIGYQPEIEQIQNIINKLELANIPSSSKKIAKIYFSKKIAIKIAASNAFPITRSGEPDKPAITFSTDLIQKWKAGLYTDDEMEALIAREIAHINSKHQQKSLVFTYFVGMILLLAMAYAPIPIPFPMFAVTGVLDVLINALMTPLLAWSALVALASYPTRSHFEANADRQSAIWTKNPLAVASALKKISTLDFPATTPGSIFGAQNFRETISNGFLGLLFPSRVVTSRIAELEKMALTEMKSDTPENNTYRDVTDTLSKLDKEYSVKLGNFATHHNSNIKREYVGKVKNTVIQSNLPNRLRGLLFEHASESKTAKAGSGLTITRTQAELKNSSKIL